MQDALGFFYSILRINTVPGTNFITIQVSSQLPKEAADVANAVADRYLTVRGNEQDDAFAKKKRVLDDQIAQQQHVVDQKSAAVAAIRSQLHGAGIDVPPAGGSIATELAAEKSGTPAQLDLFAPLRAAQAQLDTQQSALDALQLQLRQATTDYRLTPSPIVIITRAEPPEYPSLPNQSFNLIVNIFIGSGLAVVLATLCELFFWYLSRIAPPQIHVPHPAPTSVEY